MATSGYQAGVETNAVEVSYGKETTWKTAPATTFQNLRITSESLSGQKSRSRPDELSPQAQASAASTQSESAGGTISFAHSYRNGDDLLAALLNNDWTASLNIDGASGDVSAVAAGNQLTSTTSGKFTAVQVGQYVKIAGFIASAGASNGWRRVLAKPDNQTLTLSTPALVNETPTGTNAKIRGSMLRNSNLFQSLYVQKKFSTTQYLVYPGSQITAGQLQKQQGQFTTGSFTVVSAFEDKATVDASTGGVLPAPTGRVIDTVAGFQKLQLNGVDIAAAAQTVSLNVTKEGSGADYCMGSSQAQGMRIGKLTVTGTVDIYFADFTLYDQFKSETMSLLSWREVDAAGASYVYSMPVAALMNPKITAGGPNRPVMATFEVEANPDPTLGCTLQVDRFN
jgi:hypothetical protein